MCHFVQAWPIAVWRSVHVIVTLAKTLCIPFVCLNYGSSIPSVFSYRLYNNVPLRGVRSCPLSTFLQCPIWSNSPTIAYIRSVNSHHDHVLLCMTIADSEPASIAIEPTVKPSHQSHSTSSIVDHNSFNDNFQASLQSLSMTHRVLLFTGFSMLVLIVLVGLLCAVFTIRPMIQKRRRWHGDRQSLVVSKDVDGDEMQGVENVYGEYLKTILVPFT